MSRGVNRNPAILVLIGLVLRAASLVCSQTNPELTFSFEGPCGETIVGPPGAGYDDGTLGLPWFEARQAGRTWEVILTSSNHPSKRGVVHTYGFSLRVTGPLRIVDITTNGTVGCLRWEFPECFRDSGHVVEDVDPENTGIASCWVTFKDDGAQQLPPEGSWKVCKVRIGADFPAAQGETTQGEVFFTTEVGRRNVPPQVYVGNENAITLTTGDPPLMVQSCRVTLKASDAQAFIRCDVNDDRVLTIVDPVRTLNELLFGGATARCAVAVDCDADGQKTVSDAVFALMYLFTGGPSPPAPFPACDRIDIDSDACPEGSTNCT